MSANSNPLEEYTDPSSSLFERRKSAGIDRFYRGAEPALYTPTSAGTDPDSIVATLHKQIELLSQQLENEREINQKLRGLYQSGLHLSTAPDMEIAAQNTIQSLQKLLPCGLICIYAFSPLEQRFTLLASTTEPAVSIGGQTHYQPDLNHKIIMQAVLCRRIISGRTTSIEDEFPLDEKKYPTLVIAPLFKQETLRGLILFAGPENFLTYEDHQIIEAAGTQLLNRWEYAQQNETLTDLVQSIATLSAVQEAGSLMEIVASIAKRVLNASFIAVAVFDQQQWILRTSGQAPVLLRSLQNGAASFLDEAVRCPYTFRLDDITKDHRAAVMQIDHPGLHSLLSSPIRINGATSGLLLAWGKIGEPRFLDPDVFLAELLTARAAENLESCYLNQELRNSLKTTQLLFDLSLNISQTENLRDAAQLIARTAYRLLEARSCGLILFSSDGRKEAEVILPGEIPEITHPYGLIQRAMDSRQTIYMAEADSLFHIAIPIQTSRRCYGALWLDVYGDVEESHHPTEEIRILINQAAVALERSILLEETRYQARKLVQANWQMNEAYGQTLGALMRALDVRDRETEGHSERVTELSVKLGQALGLPKSDLAALKLGALLHDIGKIGISDTILLKAGTLTSSEWQAMRKHPQIGASIVQEIPALHGALPVIAFHHERWNGSGYPSGLSCKDIPLLARIFAVVDVFDAITRDRPYRERTLTMQEALEYLESQAGELFDPNVVSRFTFLIRSEYPDL